VTARVAFPTPSPPRKRPLLDGSLIFFILLAGVSGLLVLWFKGWPTLRMASWNALSILSTIAPAIGIGLFLGGLAKGLADPEKVAPVLGTQSGLRGLLLATGLGAIVPGGPFAAFPIVYALFLAGADVGAVIAFVTSWSLVALHRVVIWELPLLGFDFTLTRVIASLPLPLLAGALARVIARGPLTILPPGSPPPKSSG
jgi:uncharacterized membrane protein YraQ (UPF0718 family)